MRLDTCKSINRRLYKWKIMHFLHLRTITMFSITGLIVACLICHIAYGLPSEQIVGGADAPDGKYPYQVSVKYIGKHICGGAIVSNKYVITAARCLEGNPNDISVDVGTSRRSSNENRYATHKVIIHPNYNKTHLINNNDIGLINLEREIVLNENIKSINLTSNNYNLEGVNLTVTGWGRTSNGLMPERLQQITVTEYSQQTCNITYKYITNNHICTLQTVGQGICEGDEGDPLTYNGELIGIASFIPSPCASGNADVFTKIHQDYKEWIVNTMNASNDDDDENNASSKQYLNIILELFMTYLCIYLFL